MLFFSKRYWLFLFEMVQQMLFVSKKKMKTRYQQRLYLFIYNQNPSNEHSKSSIFHQRLWTVKSSNSYMLQEARS